MRVNIRQVVAALDAAIADQRGHVNEFDEGYESGYLDGLVRALDIVQAKAHGMTTGAESDCAVRASASV